MKNLESAVETFSAQKLESSMRAPRWGGPRAVGRSPGAGVLPSEGCGRSGAPSKARSRMRLAVVAKVQAAVDARAMHLLTSALPATLYPPEMLLELGLLSRMRRGLQSPNPWDNGDAMLCTSLVEFAHATYATLDDLQRGGLERLRRFADYNRELVAEVAAFGGTSVGLKQTLECIRRRLKEKNPQKHIPQLTRELCDVHAQLSQNLEKLCPRQHRSLLERLAGSAVNPSL